MYTPAEDSLFFAEFLKKKFKRDMSYLDMGCGSGILSGSAISCGVTKITAVDTDSECVNFVKKKGFKAIESDLFSSVDGKFDLISFNAPYLAADRFDSMKDTTGGERGDETAVRFLEQVENHLKEGGKAFLLVSSLTPLDRIKKFKVKIAARKKLFFEELLIFEV